LRDQHLQRLQENLAVQVCPDAGVPATYWLTDCMSCQPLYIRT